MADFNALEALINAHIKKNGVQAITGNILNGILRGMVSALGKGYTIAGVAVPSSDPGTMTGPLAYLAYTAGTYTHFGGLEVEQGEVAMLIYNEAVWHKEVLFSLAASATIDGNVGTPEVGVSFVDGLLTFDFRNMKGNPGDAAGFGTINATVDGNVGTPGVSVESSGPDTAKNITFQFTNLKGETGVTSVVATVDNTVGTPTCTVSLVGQQLTLAFSGLKGAQGDTGSSVDYPFTIVNNLTTNDATQALSAAMGVQLEAEVSQLEAKVDEKVQAKVVVGINKFDKTSNKLYNGYGGTTDYISNNSYRMTHPIAVEAGKTYKWPTISALGTNQKGAYCNSDGDFISSFSVTTANGYCTWTAPSDGLVRVNIGTTSYVDSFMFCEDSVYPESYVPYSKTFFIGDEYHLGAGERAEVEQMIEPLSEDVAELQGVSDAFDNVKGTNLFNKNDTKIKHGYYSSSGSYTSSPSYFVTGPISVKGGVSYKAPHPSSMGAGNTTVAIVDANNDKTGIIYGVISGDYITFTPNSDCLVSLNGGANTLINTFMVCVASEYPDEYIPYIAPYTILKEDYTPNKLTGKSVIFTGDSICAAPNDSANGGGWAKRIGEKNYMLWQNKAVSGGTIIDKDLVGSSFTICDTDFGSGADYIILEGGTNDADRIGSILNDNTPQYYGSWNETDYVTTFANSTFCDAVQRLIQRVVTSFPMAKVGFIIAPKMGVTSNGYTKETSNRRAYFETIIKICHKWGVPVLNLWDECTMNPRLSAHYTAENHGPLYYDGQHPTAQGYEVMTPIIEAWMKTL